MWATRLTAALFDGQSPGGLLVGPRSKLDRRPRGSSVEGFMVVQLITSSTQLSTVFRKLLGSCTTVHLAVAWASVGFPEHDALEGVIDLP
jgi:hypothetical protein